MCSDELRTRELYIFVYRVCFLLCMFFKHWRQLPYISVIAHLTNIKPLRGQNTVNDKTAAILDISGTYPVKVTPS